MIKKNQYINGKNLYFQILVFFGEKVGNRKNESHFYYIILKVVYYLGVISRSLTHETKNWHNLPLSRRF